MRDITKKVIVLNNFTSPYVAEALIVLKDYDPRLEGKALEEAERIVSDYIRKNHPSAKRSTVRTHKTENKKRSRLRTAIGVCLLLMALGAAAAYNCIRG